MKALVLEEIQKIQVRNIETPTCDKDETIMKVIYCSVCRTDAKMWSQGQRDLILPRVLGHEICVQKLDSNERYIVWPASTCKTCYYCKNGAENLCKSIQVIGFHRDGGFAQYIKVPRDSLIKVPLNVPSEIACMTELMASAINAIEQAKIQENQNVLIYGGGPAGLLIALGCKSFGANPLVVEKNPEKTKLILRFCKKVGIPISDAACSNNFDAAINACPDPETLSDGILRLRAGGKYCLYSGFTKNVRITTELLNEVHYRQLTLIGAYGSTKKQMKTALKVLENNSHTVSLLIQEIITLEDIPRVLPKILAGQAMKYVVNPQKYHSDNFGN